MAVFCMEGSHANKELAGSGGNSRGAYLRPAGGQSENVRGSKILGMTGMRLFWIRMRHLPEEKELSRTYLSLYTTVIGNGR